jgi:hypothetical protein
VLFHPAYLRKYILNLVKYEHGWDFISVKYRTILRFYFSKKVDELALYIVFVALMP